MSIPFFILRYVQLKGWSFTPLTETENRNLKSTILFHSHSSNCFRYSGKKVNKKKYIMYSNKQ